jgi:carbon monoxide dehydrogenase subunit G
VAITIAETFELTVDPDRVWEYLTDPRQVVHCLPGAELLEVEDERTFVGRMRVKVGPVTAGFRGRARFEEVDAAARRVRLSGEGQEQSGGGSAKMTMTSEVTALPNGRSRVRVEADVEVFGKLVQFGRGMMEEVSRQMFKQFAACVQAALGNPPIVSSSALFSTAAPPPAPPVPSVPRERVPATRPSIEVKRIVPPVPPPAQPPAPPLKLLPLLWAALKAWIARLFKR